MKSLRPVAVTAMLLAVTACSAADPTPQAGTTTPATSTPAGPPPSPSTPAPGPTPATATPATATPSTVLPGGCAASVLAGMDLTHQVGQLLMIGVPAADPASGYDEVAPSFVGGIFLAGRSSIGVAATAAAIAPLQEQARASTGVSMQVATDQEGGSVQVLSGPGFTTIPSAVRQARLELPDLSAQTSAWGAELAAAGITMDLAPVADVVPPGTEADNPPIGAFDRQYGSDPENASLNVETVVAALQSAGVDTTVKHFPGLGRVTANTDTSEHAVDTGTNAEDPALEPFVRGIAAGAAAVMVSSASYPQLDPDHIAAFSPAVIDGLLRGQLGFGGVVVSDDLGQAVAVSSVPTGLRAVDFIAAGGDLVLSVLPGDAATMSAALVGQARADPAFATRVSQSALRVLTAKQDAQLLPCG